LGVAGVGIVLSPLFERDVRYGTPIEAPTSEAMMSGLDAIFRPIAGLGETGGFWESRPRRGQLQLDFPVIIFDRAGVPASAPHGNDHL
jgi:hypothetical protein